jgi:hypothetical protein
MNENKLPTSTPFQISGRVMSRKERRPVAPTPAAAPGRGAPAPKSPEVSADGKVTFADAAGHRNYDTVLVVSKSIDSTGQFAWPLSTIGDNWSWHTAEGDVKMAATQMPYDWHTRDPASTPAQEDRPPPFLRCAATVQRIEDVRTCKRP